MDTSDAKEIYVKPSIRIVKVDFENFFAASSIRQEDAETMGGFHVGREFPHFPGIKTQD